MKCKCKDRRTVTFFKRTSSKFVNHIFEVEYLRPGTSLPKFVRSALSIMLRSPGFLIHSPGGTCFTTPSATARASTASGSTCVSTGAPRLWRCRTRAGRFSVRSTPGSGMSRALATLPATAPLPSLFYGRASKCSARRGSRDGKLGLLGAAAAYRG